jgi:hypothetical protein
MTTELVIQTLDEAMPDDLIMQELRAILRQEQTEDGCAPVELDGEYVSISADVAIEIVTKAFFKEYHDTGFPTGFRVQVAVGGVVGKNTAGLVARHCFATLFFNEAQQRFTVDFHREMR